MELNRNETKRDYVFGRLYSLMDEAAYFINPKDPGLASMLERFEQHPVGVYLKWFEQYKISLKLYPELDKEMRDIFDQFKKEDFTDKRIEGKDGYFTMGMYDEVKWIRDNILSKYASEEQGNE